MNRDDLLREACDRCMRELYEYVYPKVTWDDFHEELVQYSNKYKVWEEFRKLYDEYKDNPEKLKTLVHLDWVNKNIKECIGPKPYEFYYLPKEIMKSICDSYIYVYELDKQQNLLDTITILKDYCEKPIIDKYIAGENGHPGYRGYEYPDNLEKEVQKLIQEYDSSDISKEISKKCCNKFFKFLDMAGSFYNWNRDLNTFNMNVYLGYSPNSSKEAVIKNWKNYRNTDIEIDEEQMLKEYYDED